MKLLGLFFLFTDFGLWVEDESLVQCQGHLHHQLLPDPILQQPLRVDLYHPNQRGLHQQNALRKCGDVMSQTSHLVYIAQYEMTTHYHFTQTGTHDDLYHIRLVQGPVVSYSALRIFNEQFLYFEVGRA